MNIHNCLGKLELLVHSTLPTLHATSYKRGCLFSVKCPILVFKNSSMPCHRNGLDVNL